MNVNSVLQTTTAKPKLYNSGAERQAKLGGKTDLAIKHVLKTWASSWDTQALAEKRYLVHAPPPAGNATHVHTPSNCPLPKNNLPTNIEVTPIPRPTQHIVSCLDNKL